MPCLVLNRDYKCTEIQEQMGYPQVSSPLFDTCRISSNQEMSILCTYTHICHDTLPISHTKCDTTNTKDQKHQKMALDI